MAAIRDLKAQIRKLYGRLRRRGEQPVDAEDLVQEAFVRLLAYIRKGQTVAAPEAFLARTAFNLSVDRNRQARSALYEERTVEELLLPSLEPTPEEEVASEECVRNAAKVLEDTVGERARYVFFCHAFEDMTFVQIARKLGKHHLTIERDMAKAINALLTQELKNRE